MIFYLILFLWALLTIVFYLLHWLLIAGIFAMMTAFASFIIVFGVSLNGFWRVQKLWKKRSR